MKPIDGEQLKQTFEYWRENLLKKSGCDLDDMTLWSTSEQIQLIEAVIQEVERMPDTRNHGEWKSAITEDGYRGLFCSKCRGIIFIGAQKYCPHCGAIMDGGRNDGR